MILRIYITLLISHENKNTAQCVTKLMPRSPLAG